MKGAPHSAGGYSGGKSLGHRRPKKPRDPSIGWRARNLEAQIRGDREAAERYAELAFTWEDARYLQFSQEADEVADAKCEELRQLGYQSPGLIGRRERRPIKKPPPSAGEPYGGHERGGAR